MAKQDQSLENLKNIKYSIDTSGAIDIDLVTARKIYEHIKDLNPAPFNLIDYKKETGLNIHAAEVVKQVTVDDGNVYTMKASEHGAMVIEYTITTPDSNILNIIAPPQPAGRPHDQGDVLRGGLLDADPHNCGNEMLQELYQVKDINYHGTLARSVSKKIFEDSNVTIFALSSNMIPETVLHDPDILTLVAQRLNEDGSITQTVLTYNYGERPYYKNDAIHPYFNTKHSKARAIKVGEKEINIIEYYKQRLKKPEPGVRDVIKDLKMAFFDVMEYFSNENSLPSISLVTDRYEVELIPLEGFRPDRSHLGVWSDNFFEYVCLELLVHKDEPFNPSNPEKAKDYTVVNPGENSKLAFRIKVKPSLHNEG